MPPRKTERPTRSKRVLRQTSPLERLRQRRPRITLGANKVSGKGKAETAETKGTLVSVYA
jgi:hypothetical protein